MTLVTTADDYALRAALKSFLKGFSLEHIIFEQCESHFLVGSTVCLVYWLDLLIIITNFHDFLI